LSIPNTDSEGDNGNDNDNDKRFFIFKNKEVVRMGYSWKCGKNRLEFIGSDEFLKVMSRIIAENNDIIQASIKLQ